jgi:diguanylate cyclase (GGDEF)-like protein
MLVARSRRSGQPATPRERAVGSLSVRTYLVLILVAAFVAMAAACGYGYVWSANQARSNAFRDMSFVADRAASSLSTSLANGKKAVDDLAAQPRIDAVFAHPAGCTLSSGGGGPFPQVRLDIVSPDGTVVCSSAKSAAVLAPGVQADSGWLQNVLSSPGTVVAWHATDLATHQASVVIGQRLTHAGVAVGAVVLVGFLPGSAPALAHDLGGAGRASFTLVDSATHTVLSTSETAKPPIAGAESAGFAHTATTGGWTGLDGSHRYFGSAAVTGGSVRVYAGVRRSAVLAAARGGLTRQALTGLVALLLLAAAVWILNRRVAGPLRAVTAAVIDASQNPGTTRVAEAGAMELVKLARQFNAMLDVRAGHEAQLAHLASHDALTALPNRLLLGDRLARALRRDRSGRSVAVLFLGLDRFDTVVDSVGHEAADRVLIEVSGRLSTVLRPGDTAARFGDHEFVVVCEDIVGADTARVAERLRSSLRQPFRVGRSDIVLHASIGVATATDVDVSPEQLLREAASAMGEAKTTGRGWCLYDHALHTRATQHLEVEHDLSQALERGEMVLHYQPILQIVTGRIVGVEALVRWQHPTRGLVSPADFIPVAEQTGQIIEIGRFALTEACRQAVDWNAAGHQLRMSVNVSVNQLRNDDFPDLVEQVLTQTGLPARQLCLEITESTLIHESGPGWDSAARLRNLGVHLAIDDFGTGYSSLAYLHQLPVDELKIDRSFINRLDQDPRNRHLVEAINGMARALNLNVVAEGVETAEQHEILVAIGCQQAQGYLFAAPQPAERIVPLLQEKQRRRHLYAAS